MSPEERGRVHLSLSPSSRRSPLNWQVCDPVLWRLRQKAGGGMGTGLPVTIAAPCRQSGRRRLLTHTGDVCLEFEGAGEVLAVPA